MQPLFYFDAAGYYTPQRVFAPGATNQALPETALPLGKVWRWDGDSWEMADEPSATGGGSVSTVDRELLVSLYRVTTAFAGAAVTDIISATRMMDVSGSNAAQVGATSWFNETQGAVLATPPAAANLEPLGAPGLTDAQLRAAAVAITGGVAAGTADSGNPVKIGAKYNAAAPTYTDGQRVDLQATSHGHLGVALFGTNGAALGTYSTSTDGQGGQGSVINVAASNMVWNGATWDRMRGDTGGQWVQGGVAAGAADSGNPIKVGAKYNAALPTYLDGQRADLQVDSKGLLRVAVGNGGSFAAIATPTDGMGAQGALAVVSQNMMWNGTTWDRRRGDANGAWSQGSVAAGAVDAGNPIKVGARYNAALPTYTDGQRTDLQVDSRGSVRMVLSRNSDGAVAALLGGANDGISGSNVGLTTYTMNAVYNGAVWDRMRGDANGTWMQGNVAAGAADAGNPVKMGAKYNLGLPTYSDGQRADLQTDNRGSLRVNITSNGITASVANAIDSAAAQQGVSTFSQGMVFNGTNWDRMRGDATNGLYVQTPPRTVTNVPIASNSAVSGSVSTNGGLISAILTPANLDGATTLTFSVTTDGGTTWKNVMDQYGSEYKLAGGAVLQPNTAYAMDPTISAGLHNVRFRWGTSAAPSAGTGVARAIDIVINR